MNTIYYHLISFNIIYYHLGCSLISYLNSYVPVHQYIASLVING